MMTKRQLLDLLADVDDDTEIAVKVVDDSTDARFAELYPSVRTRNLVESRGPVGAPNEGELQFAQSFGEWLVVPDGMKFEDFPQKHRGTPCVVLYANSFWWTRLNPLRAPDRGGGSKK